MLGEVDAGVGKKTVEKYFLHTTSQAGRYHLTMQHSVPYKLLDTLENVKCFVQHGVITLSMET